METTSTHCSKNFFKAFRLLLILCAAVVAPSFAIATDCTTFTVGSGTSTQYYAPVNNFYKYSFTEILYMASELGNDAGTIESISFQYAYSTAMTSKTNVKIYMGNTSLTAFSSGSSWVTTGLTQVYSGSLNCSNGWNTFNLQTPFEYDGDNLIVVIDDGSNGYNGTSYTFYHHTTTGNTVLRTQSDGTHYALTGGNPVANVSGSLNSSRPNTKFCISASCTHRSGNFSFAGDSYTYNASTHADFPEPALTNTLSPAGTVTYTSSDPTVATVNPTTGAVTFTGAEGSVTITAISTADPYCKERDSYTINVNDGCPKFGTGTSTTSSAPLATNWKNSYEQIIFTAAEIGSGGSITSVGWNAVSSNSVARQVDIYMGETTQSQFATTSDWVDISQLTHVYSGTWNIAEGWNMFPVDFLYSGLNNLVIAIDCGATSYSSSSFYYTSATDYTVLYCYSDTYDANPSTISTYQGSVSRLQTRPNTKICISPCSIRPTFEFENTMAMCYLGNNCPMLPLTNTSTATPTFTSSDESVATVDENGVITTLDMGETTITATIGMDGDYCPAVASYVLQVICPALIPSAESISLCEGGTVTLHATTPGGGTLQWYNSVESTTPVATGGEYTVTVNQSQTYFVATANEEYGCFSSRVPAYVNVFNIAYDNESQNITGYVGVPVYGYPPAGSFEGATFSASGMPGWLHLNSDGTFTGTPTSTGSGTFTITATSPEGCSKTITVTWNIGPNNLSCCDREAFYIFKDGEPLPIRIDEDGYYYINVCKDDNATFRIQSLANCTGYTYSWRLASSTGGLLEERTGTSFTYTYDRAMGYNLTLTVNKTSSPRCSVAFPIRIRVAGLFEVATRPSFDLCAGEPFSIYVSSDGIGSVDVVRPNGASGSTLGVTDTIFLPDGVECNINGTMSCSYVSSVTFTDFSTGATIRNANDLLYVKLNMEHSYVGDICIYLTCPNGTSVGIMNWSGSGSSSCTVPAAFTGWAGTSTAQYVAFGDANDCTGTGSNGATYSGDYTTDKCDHTNGRNQPGVGWNYCWSQNTARGYVYSTSPNSRVYETANHNSQTTCMTSIDSSNMSAMTQIYRPDGNFNDFIGCPLNGEWSITVVDGFSVDNGYIFGWELGLNEDLLPDSWTYSVDIDSAWVECGWNTAKAGVYMEITPPEDWVGTTGCDLFLRDEYGCISQYENIVTVTMHESENNTEYVTGQCDPYTWPRNNQTYTEPGTYIDNQLTAFGCPDRDTLVLEMAGRVYDTINEQACQSYTWDANGQTYTASTTASVTLTSVAGCDSIVTLILEILPELTTTKDTAVCPITFPFTWYDVTFTGPNVSERTLTTSDGCDSIVSLTVTTLPKPEVSLTLPATGCPITNGQSYTIASNVTSGTAPFSYTWTGDYVGAAANASVTSDGSCNTYSFELVVTDDNGCKDTVTGSFASVDTENPTFGSAVTEYPATLSYANCEYLVPDLLAVLQPNDNCGLESQVQSPTAGTVITASTDVVVTIADFCGNTANTTVTLTVPDPLAADISNTNVACNGGHEGTVTLSNISGGSTPYSYQWSSGEITQNLTGKPAGTFTVTITDANGCTLEKSATISEAGDLVATIDHTDASCYGYTDGSVTLTSVFGGTAPYTYDWSNSGSDLSIDGVGQGSYSVTITDAQGCSITMHADVSQPTQLVATILTKEDLDCYQDNSGAVNLSVTGGSPAYTYNWNSGAFATEDLNNVAAGNYSVTVTDQHGCTASADVVLTEPDELVATIASTSNLTCYQNSTGAVDLNVTGGVPAYTYSWNSGVYTTQDLNGVPAGNYNVTVTDQHGCSATANTSLTEPTQLVASINGTTNLQCYQDNMGAIDLAVVGGTPDYTYSWTPGAYNTEDLNNVSAGTYNVVVTDHNGCTALANVTISEPALLTLVENQSLHVNVSCNGLADGSAAVVASGGTAPYSYTLNGTTNTTGAFSNLGAGSYTITVTDANGCTAETTVTIVEASALSLVEVSHSDVDCHGNNTGSLRVQASGGTLGTGYAYSLNGTSNATGSFSGLTAGSYDVMVTDANGCTANAVVQISEPELLALSEVDASHLNIDCFGNTTGALAVVATGGTPIYTYSVAGNYNTTGTFSNLSANNYTVSVEDAHGCVATTPVTLTQPAALTITENTASHVNVDCNGNSTGALAVSVAGGTPAYSYALTSNEGYSGYIDAGNGLYSNLIAGSYVISVTDDHGCQNQTTIAISQPAILTIDENLARHMDVDCYGNATGSLSVVSTGGTIPYSYELNGTTNSTGVFSGLSAGLYTISLTDAHGCTNSITLTVSEPPQLQASIVGTNLQCKQDRTGAADLTVSGGTAPYSYVWSNGATSEDISNLLAGEYSVTVVDAHGCTQNPSVIITEPDGMTLTMSDDPTICLNDQVSISVSVVGGSAPYSYQWSNSTSAMTNEQTLSPSATTSYIVTVRDQNDCYMRDTVTIYVNNPSMGVDNQSECDTYIWPTNGETYSESTNTPLVTMPNANAVGCDSTVVLHLIIRHSTIGIDTQVACDSYKWRTNGEVYTESTDLPTVTLPAANSQSCDSTVTLNLTIFNSVVVRDSTVNICENQTYTWNGYTYNTSGTYQANLYTEYGCDSTVTFVLIVHDTNHLYIYDTCLVKELPWTWENRVYETPITDDLIYLQNQWMCDSIIHYNLEAIWDCSEFLQFPSVVTPNGDGVNDIFEIVNLLEQDCYPLNKLLIYNRWGAKIYEVDNIDELSDFWDPSLHNVAAGTYYYRFDGDGFKGHVERKGVIEVVK